MRLFARDEAGENQHGPLYAGLPDGDSLFGAGDAEPIGAEFFERFGDLRPAVAVAIALHDAQPFCAVTVRIPAPIMPRSVGAMPRCVSRGCLRRVDYRKQTA